ncbi:MAG: hypothetical protein IJ491_01455 [Clostridia bacterium]|nr:hypothetical protein [Clostridia bacterium]
MNSIPQQTNGQVNTPPPAGTKKGIRTVAVMLSIVFCILTAGLGFYGFISDDREFSESENRVLSAAPALTWQSIINGSFMKDFESYLSDQFPLRDEAIRLKTFTDRLIGKREQNGVFIGEEGFLFDSQTGYNKAETEGKTEAINRFCNENTGAKQLFVLSPNSTYIYSEHLPYDITLPDQKTQINKVYASLKAESLHKLDVAQILQNSKQNGDELFYKTDHHWTTKAAYSVFGAIAEKWQLDTSNINYQFFPVTTDFEGTLSGKAGVHDAKDTIEVCIPENSAGSYVVNFESQQKKTATLFDENKLTQKNKYEVFLGGNYDKVIITTTADTTNTLLIVKDSFANCMIPMLTPYFTKIVIVDPRYMTESIKAVMSETDFSHILFLYNLNTFLEDTSIVSAFSEE